METILMSIQPKWCEKIFNGEKTRFQKGVANKATKRCCLQRKQIIEESKSKSISGYKTSVCI